MNPRKLFKNFIKDTKEGEYVVIERSHICNIHPSLLREMVKFIECSKRNVYLGTISLKHVYDRHIYDKKNPGDFFTILNNFEHIIETPNTVYLNSPEKTGDFIFVKKINEQLFMCALQIKDHKEIEIVSASATGKNYLSKFTALWSREGG